MTELTPFRVDVPDRDLHDLRQRLATTRWPERETVDDWSQGVPLDWLAELCRYWVAEYDWRQVERRLNAVPQVRTEIDGLTIHLLHARSPHPDALPLLLTHGWPGSVLEFLDVMEPLTQPADGRDAFHVVAPSLPGYGFSDRPTAPGWGIHRTARAWATLMARLGYSRYGAAGGDWGTSITSVLGQLDAPHLAGLHLVPPLAAPDPATFDNLTAEERTALADLRHAAARESGYSGQMATKPQTIGYGLVDSPVALCAWVGEKLQAWSDTPLSRDQILDDVTLYWLTGTGASAARMYWESFDEVSAWFNGQTTDTVDVPVGCSVFPREVPRISRRWAEQRFTDIRWWDEPAVGGHFAAYEQPALFVDQLRSFFRLVR